jgi:hypothetical protein
MVGKRLGKLVATLVLLFLVLPSSAFAQATRTWVSGVGNDANPCSLTAPCKTFAGAISKTAIGGIIDALDPGGFGTVTITKSITIDGHNTLAGILASATTGVNVNLTTTLAQDPAQKVILRGLDIEGAGNPTRGVTGVKITSAKVVRIENSQIYEFSQNGINYVPTTPNARLVVQDTTINDNLGNGIMAAPNAASGTGVKVTLRNDNITDNACGATASSTGAGTAFSTNCGALAAGVGSRIAINSFDTLFSDNTFVGVLAKGSQATQRIGNCEISANATGVQAIDAGADVQAYTGTNYIGNNTTNGVPTSFLPPV